MHYFYLARCSDGSLYAGTCIDLSKRQAMHNSGKGAKYTRSRRPVTIIYHERHRTLGSARSREAEVKQWVKAQKEKLVFAKDPIPAIDRSAGTPKKRQPPARRRAARK